MSKPSPVGTRHQRAHAFVEREHRRAFAALRGRHHEVGRQRRLAGARGADQQRAGAAVEAAAEQRVEGGQAAGDALEAAIAPVFGRDQARKHAQAAGQDFVVVVAAAEAAAAELADAQAAPVAAVLGIELVQRHHAVHDRVHVQAELGHGAVVEQQHGAATADEVLLQREDLAAIAQRRASEQAQFRQRVEHDALRTQALDLREDALGGVTQLDLGRMEHRVLVFGVEPVLRRGEFMDMDAVKRPAVRCSDLAQLRLGLRQGYVKHRLPARHPAQQELQCQRRLARPGHAFDQIQAMRREATREDGIQAGNARACSTELMGSLPTEGLFIESPLRRTETAVAVAGKAALTGRGTQRVSTHR